MVINPGSVSRARGMSKESYAIININKMEKLFQILCVLINAIGNSSFMF